MNLKIKFSLKSHNETPSLRMWYNKLTIFKVIKGFFFSGLFVTIYVSITILECTSHDTISYDLNSGCTVRRQFSYRFNISQVVGCQRQINRKKLIVINIDCYLSELGLLMASSFACYLSRQM
ncbi:THAP-type domain-containing protein [Aphis craccivora]|uniref:THAP-type domain-containing protein n=1 Tax=Aphis craccivora TaxID=307492 RepID=A0A6G0ZR60_APHCR|nr:THAP-type domain-containing protein [Aphis craccivora]